MRTDHLFVSHSWRYSNQYDSLVRLLKNRKYFAFRDYSVPADDPIHHANNDTQLRQAIRVQMSSCHCVLILAGVYATYSKWINIEIDLAKQGFAKAKPIIAIRPRGNNRMSQTVREAADSIVRWNTKSIVEAIRVAR